MYVCVRARACALQGQKEHINGTTHHHHHHHHHHQRKEEPAKEPAREPAREPAKEEKETPDKMEVTPEKKKKKKKKATTEASKSANLVSVRAGVCTFDTLHPAAR